MDSDQDSEHLWMSDCHSSETVQCHCSIDISEGKITGNYVLKMWKAVKCGSSF